MNEVDARTVLLIQAIESSGEASLLTPAQGREASELVRAGLPQPGRSLQPREWSERFLLQRAQRLLQDAAARRPGLQALIEPSPWWPLVQAAIVLAGFAAGFASDALVNPERINLLSAPLLGVVAWNGALALLWLLSRLLLRRRRRVPRLPAFAASLAAWPGRWRRGGFAVAGRFGRVWLQAAAPLWQARLRAALHLGAAAVALGLIAYVGARALPNEFRVGWESQLLKTPEGVHRLLLVLFLPVSLLSALLQDLWPGLAALSPFTPDELARMHHWRDLSPDLADRWLQQVTALLVVAVVLPRLLLWALQARRARRLRRHFPLDLSDPYFVRLLAAGSGQRVRLVVWPYGVAVDGARAAALARHAQALLGAEAALSLQPSTPYGDALGAMWLKPKAAEGELLEFAALLSLSATPEAETHGAFLQRLTQVVGPRALVVLDSGPFLRRLGPGRLREREALWRAFVEGYGFARVHVLDLEGADDAGPAAPATPEGSGHG